MGIGWRGGGRPGTISVQQQGSWRMHGAADRPFVVPRVAEIGARMEAVLGQERAATPEAMRLRVLGEARRAFADRVVSEADLESCVSQVVDGLWTERTRVTAFIPVLAMREVRALLDQE
jgi:hypothetical protein